MKRIMALLMTLALIMALVGCGAKKPANQTPGKTSETQAESKPTLPTANISQETVMLNDTELFSNDYATITATRLDQSEHAQKLYLTVTNNMDVEIGVSVKRLAMNGCMAEDGGHVSLEPGESGECIVEGDAWILEDVYAIDLSIEISEYHTWKSVYRQIHTLYPQGAETRKENIQPYQVLEMLVDNGDIYAVITEQGSKGDKYYIKGYCANDTTEDVHTDVRIPRVNGIGSDSNWDAWLLPGCYDWFDLELDVEDLDMAGFDTATVYDIRVTAADSDRDKVTKTWADDLCTVYPEGQENARYFEYEKEDSHVVLWDAEDVKITYTGVYERNGSNHIALYTENNRDTEVRLNEKKILINNQSIYTMTFGTIAPGSDGFLYIYYSQSDLEYEKLEHVSWEGTINRINPDLLGYTDLFDISFEFTP